jgi:hypothetical protein
MMTRITKFCPPGMQIASPGGLSFDLDHLAAVEVTDGRDGTLVLHYVGGGSTTLRFHSNHDGGPPDIYGLKRNIEAACNAPRDPITGTRER